MRILITGGAGFIGSNLCKRLVDDNYEVIIVDNLSTGHQDNLSKDIEFKRITLGVNQHVLKHMVGEVDVVFHLAAVPRVSFSVEHPFETANNNIMSTVAVLEYARMMPNHPRVIYASSSSIYGGADVLPTPEDYPADPKSPYALEKWQGEEWCRMYSAMYGLDTVCLRFFNVIGPGSRYGGAYSTVLSAWMYHTLVDNSVSPYIEGDGFQSRDFSSIENVIDAMLLAAKHPEKFHGDAFNVAQGESHSLWDCKKILEDIYERSFDLEERPERIGDVRNTLADISKARNVLGYNPNRDFRSQVERMANWYKSFYKNKNANS